MNDYQNQIPWLKFIGMGFYMLFEYWLGKTKRFEGNSLIEVLQNAGIKILRKIGILKK